MFFRYHVIKGGGSDVILEQPVNVSSLILYIKNKNFDKILVPIFNPTPYWKLQELKLQHMNPRTHKNKNKSKR